MLRLRHFGRLLRELAGYAAVNGAYWLLPLVLLLLVVAILVVVGQVAAPLTIYPLF